MAKKILVIDDSESIRELISVVLENAGFEVAKAVDGKDGLARLDTQDFNLVITDLNMPNMDGITFIRTVRTSNQQSMIPIIMLTTESQASFKEKAREAGATGWITKPFATNRLLSIINNVVR